MAKRIKQYISNHVLQHCSEVSQILNVNALKIWKTKKSGQFEVHLPSKNSTILVDHYNKSTEKSFITNVSLIHSKFDQGINFVIDKDFFIKNTINDVINPIKDIVKNPVRCIIEYSSPNIAKPFHVGHLRSTIIGNFLSNINMYLDDDVVRLNYLGDWGTQFGLLKVGLDIENYTDEQIKENPIQLLYEAYVKANKLAECDQSIGQKARQAFTLLENGDEEELKRWSKYREYSMEELKKTYDRIGVTFDEYNWESMYNSNEVKFILNELEEMGIVKTDEVGKKVAIVNDRKVTVTKSDGSTLYLTRDIAAALDRYKRYSFNQMLYVVDNAQSDHFVALFGILDQMNTPFAKQCKHVKFGRIRGMSTRKGNVVFLKDILDEAKEIMHMQQLKSINTKVCDEMTSDILGTTAVVINDLKQRRQRDYEFSWEHALQSQGDSGIRLQYLHCRLWSIEQNCGVKVPKECIPELISEPEALFLIEELARFDDVVRKAKDEMESCILVLYLFQLSTAINKTIKVLQVKDQPKDLAEQRLMLFHAARLVVKKSLEILGVNVLNQM